jgi:hypothetical protein
VFDVSSRKPRRVATLDPLSEPSNAFGVVVALDRDTIAARADDGVHTWRRSGRSWVPNALIPPPHGAHTWFAADLAFGADMLWVGDPASRDDRGHVHGYQRE